jgi:hypothetical protein
MSIQELAARLESFNSENPYMSHDEWLKGIQEIVREYIREVI